MDESGISLTGLTIGSAAIGAIAGIVTAWIKARYSQVEVKAKDMKLTTRIEPQPVEVRNAGKPIDAEAYREHRAADVSNFSNLFARMSGVEQRVSAVEAGFRHQAETIRSMDGKLDTIIGKLKGDTRP